MTVRWRKSNQVKAVSRIPIVGVTSVPLNLEFLTNAPDIKLDTKDYNSVEAHSFEGWPFALRSYQHTIDSFYGGEIL